MIWLFVGISVGVVLMLVVGYLCFRAYKLGHNRGFEAGGKTMHSLIQSNIQKELAEYHKQVSQMNGVTDRKDLQA